MAQVRVEDLMPDIPGDVNGDGCVNLLDVSIMARHWLMGCEEPVLVN